MLKVLIVDDEVFVRKGIVLETDWAALGFEVVAEAENGLGGLMRFINTSRISSSAISGCRKWAESRC